MLKHLDTSPQRGGYVTNGRFTSAVCQIQTFAEKRVTIMTYGTPQLLLVGSAQTLVRGTSNVEFGYTGDNSANCTGN
jgi:hypothetical protein